MRNMEEDDVISEGFKMTEFGFLPVEWEIESLERVWQIITGTTPRRMNQVMDKYKREKTIIAADGNWFNFIFKSGSEKWSEKGITERVMGINTEIKKNQKMSRQNLSAILGINPSAVQKHMAKLKDKGLVERVDLDKGGYWRVIEDEDRS